MRRGDLIAPGRWGTTIVGAAEQNPFRKKGQIYFFKINPSVFLLHNCPVFSVAGP